jgi:hypothetical protein
MKSLLLLALTLSSQAFAVNYIFERGLAEGRTPFQMMKEGYAQAKPATITAAFPLCKTGELIPNLEFAPLLKLILPTTKMDEIGVGTRRYCYYHEVELVSPAVKPIGTIFPGRPAQFKTKNTIAYFWNKPLPTDKTPIIGISDEMLTNRLTINGEDTLRRPSLKDNCGKGETSITVRDLEGSFIARYETKYEKCPSETSFDYLTKN